MACTMDRVGGVQSALLERINPISRIVDKANGCACRVQQVDVMHEREIAETHRCRDFFDSL